MLCTYREVKDTEGMERQMEEGREERKKESVKKDKQDMERE